MDAGLRRLADVEKKVRSGERLDRQDGIALFASDDLAWLGGLAHEVRTLKNGDAAHFAEQRGIDLAEVEPAEAVRLATGFAADGATELHLSVPAEHDLEQVLSTLRELRAALPAAVALHACTPAGIRRLATASGTAESDVLEALTGAGLTSLAEEDTQAVPQTGPAQAAREPQAAPDGEGDDGWADWSRIHRLAHRKGLTTACTLRYGTGEEVADRVDHLLRLRALQDETGGFRVLVPLRHGAAHGATGADILRTFAVCRLLLDNVPHLAARWAEHSAQTAQLALQHGADEMAGRLAGSASPSAAGLTRQDLLDLIRDAGFRPVERDAHYGALRTHEGPDPDRRESPQPMRV